MVIESGNPRTWVGKNLFPVCERNSDNANRPPQITLRYRIEKKFLRCNVLGLPDRKGEEITSVVVQSPSHVGLFATPRTTARQASLSFTLSQSLLKFVSIELVMLSNHLILCCPLLFLPSEVQQGYPQFSSVAQSCSTLCDPVDCSISGIPVHHQLREFTQTHVHWVGDAIQPSHPPPAPSPPAFNLY